MANSYNKRYIASIVIEANTPLKVGSSDIDMLQDSPVQKDWNELPMILGTSIAGVLRKEFSKDMADDIFGSDCSRFEDKKEKEQCLKNAKGSRIIISNALLYDQDMKVIEHLKVNKSDFLKNFDNLPIREHTAITDKGVAKETNKFDEEVVYKGAKFRFRIEFIADDNDEVNWQEILKAINAKTFRLGGGSTKGFGDIKVLNELSSYDVFDITSKEYREKSSSLNTTYSKSFPKKQKEINYTTYTLKIKPDNFFMFGSGFGDDDANMTPVYEKIITWENNKGKFSNEQILIPASSIKGAISHRTTYHYNLQNKLFIGNNEAKESIKELFGEAKQSDDDLGCKGKVLFSDCFYKKADEKVFDHVSIDRFTGGAIDGALFQEKTISDNQKYSIEILLEKDIKDEYIKAFEKSLDDICSGMLPLGGATTKGHGVFSGKVFKDGVELKDENNTN